MSAVFDPMPSFDSGLAQPMDFVSPAAAFHQSSMALQGGYHSAALPPLGGHGGAPGFDLQQHQQLPAGGFGAVPDGGSALRPSFSGPFLMDTSSSLDNLPSLWSALPDIDLGPQDAAERELLV